MAAFKIAVAKGRHQGAVTQARRALQRPIDRALVDLFMYREQGLRLAGTTPEALHLSLTRSPELRPCLGKAWVRRLRPLFPNVHIVQTLATLYWWGAQDSTEPERWRDAIAFSVALACHPRVHLVLPPGASDVREEVEAAVIGRIRSALERDCGGGSAEAGARSELIEQLDLEWKAARVLRSLDFRANGVSIAAGPLLLSRVGLLASIKGTIETQLKSCSSDALLRARILLGPHAAVTLLIERGQFEAAENRLGSSEQTPEVCELLTQALRGRARLVYGAGDIKLAFDLWRRALESTLLAGERADVRLEISRTIKSSVRRLGADNLDGQVMLLAPACDLTDDVELRAMLAEAAYSRAHRHRISEEDLSDSGLRQRGAMTLGRQKQAVSDIELAAQLGLKPAQAVVPAFREKLELIERRLADLHAPPRLAVEQMTLPDVLSRSELEHSDHAHGIRLSKIWDRRLAGAGATLDFSRLGRKVAVGVVGGTTLYRTRDGVQTEFLSDSGTIQAVVFSPRRENELFEGSDTGQVGTWLLERDSKYRHLKSGGEVLGLTVSRREQWVAVRRRGARALEIFDPEGVDERYHISVPTAPVAVVSVPDEKWVVAYDDQISICDILAASVGESTELDCYANAMAVSSNGCFVAVGGTYGEVEILDVPDFDQIDWFDGEGDCITSLSFSRDGRYLAAGSTDGTVQVFSLRESDVVGSYRHEGLVTCVRFSPSENVLASVSEDERVMLWRVKG